MKEADEWNFPPAVRKGAFHILVSGIVHSSIAAQTHVGVCWREKSGALWLKSYFLNVQIIFLRILKISWVPVLDGAAWLTLSHGIMEALPAFRHLLQLSPLMILSLNLLWTSGRLARLRKGCWRIRFSDLMCISILSLVFWIFKYFPLTPSNQFDILFLFN